MRVVNSNYKCIMRYGTEHPKRNPVADTPSDIINKKTATNIKKER